jgi:hypothetical protein
MKISMRILSTITLVLLVEAGLIYLNQSEWRAAESEPYSNHLDWVTTWGGTDYDNAKSVAVNGGNIYVAGTTRSYGAGLSDIFLLKYDPNGDLAWNKTWGGVSFDGCWATVADNEGIYVAGFTYAVGNLNANAALLKFDSDGNLIWSRTWGGSDDAVARGVTVDGNGAVYVAGYLRGTTTTTKSFLLRYDQAGELIWNTTFGGVGVNAFAVGVGNGVYVDGTNETTVNNLYESKMFLTKFNEDGSILWSRQWGNTPINYCWSISVDGDNIYQAGTMSDGSNNSDAVLLNYDTSGNLRFNVTWGKTEEEYAWGITRSNNYIYLTGHIYNKTSISFDTLLVKFALNGTPIWNVTYGDKSTDVAHSVAVDGNDIYVTGITTGADQNSQVLLLKYTSANELSNLGASWAAAAATAIAVLTLTAFVLLILDHKRISTNPSHSG